MAYLRVQTLSLGTSVLLLAAVLQVVPATAQDVFASGSRNPAPLETRRNCTVPDSAAYTIRNPPSCASRIAKGRRLYGVEPTFVTLRESRQIPASWQHGSPWGPCAEGESLIFFTPAGRRLFEQTQGQCDDVFAGRGTPGTGSRTPGGGTTPPLRSGTPAAGGAGPAGDSALPNRKVPTADVRQTGFPCFDPPRGERESVRGMPGGRSCELRNGDELWCRQRNAMTRDVWLPTNPSWPMKPVGVRVLADCRIVALDGDAPVRLKGRVERSANDDTPPALPPRGPAEWRYADPGNPTPVGDGMLAAFKACFEDLKLFNAEQYRALKHFDFVRLESLLGLGRRDEGGRLEQRRTLLGLSLEQLDKDLGTRIDVTDFERGYRLGQRLCAYYPAAEGLGTAGKIGNKILSASTQRADFRPRPNYGSTPPRIVRDPARPGAQLEPDAARTRGGPHDLTDAQVLEGYAGAGSTYKSELFKAIRNSVSEPEAHAAAETVRRTRPTGKRVQLSASTNGSSVQTVQIGDFVGNGAFGDVFDIVPANGGPAREVIKIVHNTAPAAPGPAGQGSARPSLDQGAASVKRQLQGSVLLNDAGIDTPLVSDHRVGTAIGDPSWIIMEKIDVSTGLVENFDGTRFPKILKKTAVRDLFERMVAKNLVGADLHAGNVYFYADRTGRVRAGVWDTDFILRTDRPIDSLVREDFLFQVQAKQGKAGIIGQPFNFNDPRGSMEMMYRIQWENR